MKHLKNAAGRTDQHMHNIEDARVKGGTEPHQEPERKSVKWLKKVAKFAQNYRNFCIFENSKVDHVAT